MFLSVPTHKLIPPQIRIGLHCSIATLSKLFAESIPLLKKLSLAHSALTNEMLDVVAKSCRLLESLVIDNCPQVTTLPSGLHQLLHFSCALCYKIGDTTLRKFVSVCQNLNSMNLFFCQSITDAGLAKLNGTHMDSLIILDLANCSEVPHVTILDATVFSQLHLLLYFNRCDCCCTSI